MSEQAKIYAAGHRGMVGLTACQNLMMQAHARQEIPFTDFPMPAVSLYA